MGLFNSIRLGASGAADSGYEIQRSLRINRNDSAHLTRTPSSAGNRRTYTISCWVKKTATFNQAIFYAGTSVGTNHNNVDAFLFDGSDRLSFFGEINQSVQYTITTTRKFRDQNSWYHIILAVDTTQATSSNRVKLYVNGEQITDFDTANYPSQNSDRFVNATNLHVIGYTSSGRCLMGYFAEYNFIDGQQLTPASFGETDVRTGQWNPIEYTGTYGTNGFYLNFSDNSAATATTLGKDSSGNGNNYTPVYLNAHESVIDTPTNNFAIFQMMGTPFSSGATFREGGLQLITGSTSSGRNLNRQAFAPFLVNSGKWYAEFVGRASDNANFVGVGPYQVEISPTSNNTRYAYVYSDGDSYLRTAGSESIGTYGGGIPTNNVIGVYLDMDATTPVVYFSSNGQWADGSGNFNQSSPTAGLTLGNSFFTTDTGGWDGYGTFIASSAGGSYNMTIHANFGQDSTFAGLKSAGGNTDANGLGDFAYPVPTGAKAMCSANLSEPSILLPNKHFDTLLYTGTGTSASQNITGLEFDPDWVWAKNRDAAYDHELYDTVRGDNKRLFFADQPLAENSNGPLSFGVTGGFALAALSGGINVNGDKHIAWNWNGGSSTVTNNNGSISSQVRTNATAGFSILTYTGTGSAGATVGHGLGVTPDVIIIKNRTDSSGAFWAVYHKEAFESASDPNIIYFNSDQAEADDTNVLGTSVTINSTVFSLGNYNGTNGSGDNMVSYCFSEVKNYSKFGTYRGNGNADGTFIYTGFRPAFIIIKNVSSTTEWRVYDDDLTNGANPVNKMFHTNRNYVEQTTSHPVDFVSNGVKMRGTFGEMNSSGDQFVYICFAKSPFKYSRAN